MSRAQGDGFRTWTDESLNQYRAKLNVKISKLINEREKWINVNDDYMILCVCGNEIENPNGSWKWDGWKVTGQYYRVSMYEKENLKITENHILVIGLPISHFATNDKTEANLFYKELVTVTTN